MSCFALVWEGQGEFCTCATCEGCRDFDSDVCGSSSAWVASEAVRAPCDHEGDRECMGVSTTGGRSTWALCEGGDFASNACGSSGAWIPSEAVRAPCDHEGDRECIGFPATCGRIME